MRTPLSRRALLALFAAFRATAQPDTPKNRTALEANAFNRMFAAWADAFNKVKSGGIDAGECEAWEPLPKQFRKMEHTRMEWIRGTK